MRSGSSAGPATARAGASVQPGGVPIQNSARASEARRPWTGSGRSRESRAPAVVRRAGQLEGRRRLSRRLEQLLAPHIPWRRGSLILAPRSLFQHDHALRPPFTTTTHIRANERRSMTQFSPSSLLLVTAKLDSANPHDQLEDLNQALGNGKLGRTALIEFPQFKVGSSFHPSPSPSSSRQGVCALPPPRAGPATRSRTLGVAFAKNGATRLESRGIR